MNDTIKAVGIAATLLASPVADAWGGGYYTQQRISEPRDIRFSKSFKAATCVGADLLTAQSRITVYDFAVNNFRARNAAEAAANVLQNAWQNTVYQDVVLQPNQDMLMFDFRDKAMEAETNVSLNHGVSMEIEAQDRFGVSYNSRSCAPVYIQPPVIVPVPVPIFPPFNGHHGHGGGHHHHHLD